jgi:5-methylcytosine-specific restriction endonuclease McrA
LARKLVDVGLWETVEGGYLDLHYLIRNQAASKVKARRAGDARRQALGRDPELRRAIRERDRDLCRYCGIKVRWTDRKSVAGGTYDHVDPSGDNIAANVVVACRGCNSSKGCRTPEEAGMPLRPAPDSVTTQIGSKSGSRSNPVSPNVQLPPSKEGKGGRPPASRGGAGVPEDQTRDHRSLPAFGAPRDPEDAARARRGAAAVRAIIQPPKRVNGHSGAFERLMAVTTAPDPAPHVFDDDGTGSCLRCSLPYGDEVHAVSEAS